MEAASCKSLPRQCEEVHLTGICPMIAAMGAKSLTALEGLLGCLVAKGEEALDVLA